MRADVQPILYKESVRTTIESAMRNGQSVALVLRLRLDDHVLYYPYAAEVKTPVPPMRDAVTLAAVPERGGVYAMHSCMADLLVWLKENGLGWFLATHEEDRTCVNEFAAPSLPIIVKTMVPSTFSLFAYWNPVTYDSASGNNPLNRQWIAHTMLSTERHWYKRIVRAMNSGQTQCVLQMLTRDKDYYVKYVGEEQRDDPALCTTSVKHSIDRLLITPPERCFVLDAARYTTLIHWLINKQGIGWHIANTNADTDGWAYLVAAWSK